MSSSTTAKPLMNWYVLHLGARAARRPIIRAQCHERPLWDVGCRWDPDP
jgi:hypothetical protein